MTFPVMKKEESPWIPFEDRRRARSEKRDAVLRMAVKMFLEDGYHRTSLTDVAARLNITKPALYNYFRNKEDILIECYRAGFALYDETLAAELRDNDDGIKRLRSLIRAYALVITTDFGRCIVRLDDRELAPASRKEVRKSKRRIDDMFRTEIARGVADGSIAPCDQRMTSLVITGALNGIGDWFEPNGNKSAEGVAEHFARQLSQSIST